MWLAGYIPLVREDRGSIRETYAKAKAYLSQDVPVFFFPEGTRSHTGHLGAFKNGAFKLSMQTGAPIIPIVVTGTQEVLRRGSWLFRGTARLGVAVLPAVDPNAFQAEEPDGLRNHVKQLIQERLDSTPP